MLMKKSVVKESLKELHNKEREREAKIIEIIANLESKLYSLESENKELRKKVENNTLILKHMDIALQDAERRRASLKSKNMELLEKIEFQITEKIRLGSFILAIVEIMKVPKDSFFEISEEKYKNMLDENQNS